MKFSFIHAAIPEILSVNILFTVDVAVVREKKKPCDALVNNRLLQICRAEWGHWGGGGGSQGFGAGYLRSPPSSP